MGPRFLLKSGKSADSLRAAKLPLKVSCGLQPAQPFLRSPLHHLPKKGLLMRAARRCECLRMTYRLAFLLRDCLPARFTRIIEWPSRDWLTFKPLAAARTCAETWPVTWCILTRYLGPACPSSRHQGNPESWSAPVISSAGCSNHCTTQQQGFYCLERLVVFPSRVFRLASLKVQS